MAVTDIDPSLSGTDNSKTVTGLPAEKRNFWAAVFESMKSPPDVDFEKLANLAGYRNANTARTTYNMQKSILLGKVSSQKKGSRVQKNLTPKEIVAADASVLAANVVKKRGRSRRDNSESVKSDDYMPGQAFAKKEEVKDEESGAELEE